MSAASGVLKGRLGSGAGRCGCRLGSRFRLGRGRLSLLGRSQDGVERGAFHAGHELNDAGFTDVRDEAVDDLVAKVAMRHLAAFEAKAGLDLVALSEEAD